MSGCSAGAQLATLVGVTNGSARHEGKGQWGKVSSRVQAIVSMDGIATFVSPGEYSRFGGLFQQARQAACQRHMARGIV